MLTADLVRLRRTGATIRPVALNEKRARPIAEELLRVFSDARGMSMESLEKAIAEIEVGPTDVKVLRGLAKLLTDQASVSAIDGTALAARRARRDDPRASWGP